MEKEDNNIAILKYIQYCYNANIFNYLIHDLVKWLKLSVLQLTVGWLILSLLNPDLL